MSYVGISGDGSFVYVLLDKREDFDKVPARCCDHGESEHGGHVLTKTVKSRSCSVMFQFWIKDPRPSDRIRAEIGTSAI
jgi:hypothetical protein